MTEIIPRNWPAVERAVLAALHGAGQAGELKQRTFRDPQEEKIVQNGLDRLFYERLLPNGGDKEMKLAQRLVKLANGSLKDESDLGLIKLAEQYTDTKNWYYTLKPLSDGAQARSMKRQQTERLKSEDDRNLDLIWFCELRLKGIPTRVANFRMEVYYTLIRADGKRDRIVEIITEKGERSGKVRLDAESFSSPSGRAGFRVWQANRGNGCWQAGERELQALQLDVAHDAAFMDVHEVPSIGWHEESRIWFKGDSAFTGNTEIWPDEDGVYWKDGIGYQLSNVSSGGQPFAQIMPLMYPGKVLQLKTPGESPGGTGGSPVFPGPVAAAGDEQWAQEFCLVDAREAKRESDLEAVRLLFAEMIFRFKEALGGYDAYLMIGAILAFLFRPEFFKSEKAFPGLFTHGETKQGKSTATQWVMELQGYHQMSEGIGLGRDSTAVGLQIALEQNSCEPVWLSDYNNEVSEDKRAVVHGGFGAAGAVKWTADGAYRRKRTIFVIDGESRPTKVSTRYRYLQIPISKANRKSNQVWWMEKNRPFFFSIVRELLRHREQFSALGMQKFHELSQAMSDIERRSVQVHGAATAAFAAAVEFFHIAVKSDMEAFYQFVREKAMQSSDESDKQVNVEQAWAHLISAWRQGAFGETVQDWRRYFNSQFEPVDHAPGKENQTPWEIPRLFIEPKATWDVVAKELRKSNRAMPLDITDLREQMSHRSYWSPRNADRPKQRFAGVALHCWEILLDRMDGEFGYRPISDEALEASKRSKNPSLPGGVFPTEITWIDPRKGDLYALAEAVRRKPGEAET
jgi:hypothetical protein